MRVPLPRGPSHLLLRRRWANRITAGRSLAGPNFHPYRSVTTVEKQQWTQTQRRVQTQQRTNRSEDELEKTIKLVDQILKENNFDVYMKGMGDGGVPKAATKEVDAYKFLHLLNRILLLSREGEGSSDAKTNIWECPTFLNLLGYIRLKIPSFNTHEMFLFALCFSKIQFMPQMLMQDFLLTVQEKTFLQGFFEEDVNKFFQFFFIVTSIKNVRMGDKTDSLFATFASNFVQVVLDFLAGGGVTSEECTPGDLLSDLPSDLPRRLPLDCYHLLCVALHNANVRNAPLMHRVGIEIVHLLDRHHPDQNDRIDAAKKLINIYLAYASLRCENYHLYEKLNTFLYSLIEELPLASCLTLLLSIATLKEQNSFNFPLCMLSSLEKHFYSKFYSLDEKDLLLLIYLLSYLNLHVANTDTYVCMLDYLLNFHKFEPSQEDERVKLFQIYVTLMQSFPSEISGGHSAALSTFCDGGDNDPSPGRSTQGGGLHHETASHTNGRCGKEVEAHELDQAARRNCDEEVEGHELHQAARRTMLQNALRKIQGSMQMEPEQSPQEYAQELNEHVDSLHEMLLQMSGNTFFIKNLSKNRVLHNYYLSHICFDLKKEESSETESQKIAILFDTDRTHLCDNSFDIYYNMKRNHLTKLNIKCFSINLHQWRELSPEERRQFIAFELTHRYFPCATSSA
ncbi:hypothetical protein C922_00892 [Plasmodium inui San Antonio 1]|uniref:RAP domain-containing protein n=1 Tax=Plasmodium inui San Antonio 1 TaxID=1237626 RepID=W7ASQ2_9APIC|nr:hypothetical protein C922_00892 [Plasmodium inui San Antonio 1]EUD68496.1 hypothetical protein C922_00892 [Plasmodium inui San Antonio 1]